TGVTTKTVVVHADGSQDITFLNADSSVSQTASLDILNQGSYRNADGQLIETDALNADGYLIKTYLDPVTGAVIETDVKGAFNAETKTFYNAAGHVIETAILQYGQGNETFYDASTGVKTRTVNLYGDGSSLETDFNPDGTVSGATRRDASGQVTEAD